MITALLLHVICPYYVRLGHDSEPLSCIWFTCIRVIGKLKCAKDLKESSVVSKCVICVSMYRLCMYDQLMLLILGIKQTELL